MTEPVAPGTLTPLTPQISLDAGIAAVSANRVVHFDETVRMVEQLNEELPRAHQNAVSAGESAAAANTSKNAAETAKNGAESARDASVAAKNAAEAAAGSVGNPVAKADKATAADVTNGTADKWVDAARLKAGLDSKANSSHTHTASQISGLGTAATVNTGTTGATIPLLNGANTWTANQAYSGSVTVAGDLRWTSDARLKKNIEPVQDALSAVLAIAGVKYDRVDIAGRYIGVLAQDVQRVLPEAVNQENDVLSVNYLSLIAVLIEAVRELDAKVKALEVTHGTA